MMRVNLWFMLNINSYMYVFSKDDVILIYKK